MSTDLNFDTQTRVIDEVSSSIGHLTRALQASVIVTGDECEALLRLQIAADELRASVDDLAQEMARATVAPEPRRLGLNVDRIRALAAADDDTIPTIGAGQARVLAHLLVGA